MAPFFAAPNKRSGFSYYDIEILLIRTSQDIRSDSLRPTPSRAEAICAALKRVSGPEVFIPFMPVAQGISSPRVTGTSRMGLCF
jgi:hypothetical protein